MSETKAKLFRKGVAIDGDVLFAHNATVGPVALLKTNLDSVILSTTATYFRCNKAFLCNIFLKYALQAPFFVKQYQAVMAQSTRFQVPITAQRKLSLVLPSLPEQQAIATALSDVDALITSLDGLIAKKRDIKQATMQQLFTGKTRLPGFSGKWDVKKLSDVFNVTAGGDIDLSRSSSIQDEVHCFPIYSNALSNNGLYGFCSYSDHQANSITVTARGTLGIANFRNHNFTAIGRVLVLQPSMTVDGRFFSEFINNQIDFVVESTGVPQLTAPHIAKYKLPVPPLSEQQAIATVLSDMDAEIAALEQKRNKIHALKQGMMQELLTGKTRLL